MIGYHFTSDTLRDGRPIPPIGEWLEHDGPIEPCRSGLHASEHPFDAFTYAPEHILHKVGLEGDLQSHGDPIDKWVGRRRKILATIDAEPLLREFARWCALQVIELWDAPLVVRQYLETGDESLRTAARDAAGDAARDAARAAARDAAWDAAGAAARDAAQDATRAVAAAQAAAWDAAWAAARAAAGAGAAARAAAWAAAATWDAAWAAARDAQREKFRELTEARFRDSETMNGVET